MDGLGLAIARGYHLMTPAEMGADMRAHLASLPRAAFEALEPGQAVYMSTAHGGGRRDCFRVTKTTPKRRQLEALRFGEGQEPFRAYRGDYPGEFFVLDDWMVAIMFVAHEDVVREALRLGLEVPARVRVHHPAMFVELPERFSPEKLKETLKPDLWGEATPERLDKMIEACRKNAGLYERALADLAGRTPDWASGYGDRVREYGAEAEFYLWLMPHVSPGGVFYTGPPAAPAWRDAPAAPPAAPYTPYLPFG